MRGKIVFLLDLEDDEMSKLRVMIYTIEDYETDSEQIRQFTVESSEENPAILGIKIAEILENSPDLNVDNVEAWPVAYKDA